MVKKIFTFGQVVILVFGIVAISWAVGSEVGVVSGVKQTYRLNTNEGVVSQLYGELDNTQLKKINEYYVIVNGKEYTVNEMINTPEGKNIAKNLPQGQIIYSPGYIPTGTGQSTSTSTGSTTITPFPSKDRWYEDTDSKEDPNQIQVNVGDDSKNEIVGFDQSEFGETGGDITSFPEEFKGENIEYNEPSWYESILGESGESASITEVGQYWGAGIAIAAATKAAAQPVAKGLGTTDEQAAAIGEGLEKGIQAGATVNALMKFYNKGYSGNAGTYIGLAVAAWYILNTYKDVDEKSVTFECSVWEAPKGGTNCEKCNNAIFGCSEYQCKSLGKGCELLNPGTDEELCAWVNRNDAQEPRIEAWRDALSEEYQYTPDTAQSPPDRGVIIKLKTDAGNQQSCIPAYTRLEFGVQLDEPATCKIDTERKSSYEEMDYYLGSSSLARYNHSHTMSLPSINATGTIIQSGGNMSLYVRCEDANGNSNTGEFVFKFCVEPEEDFTAPLITETDPTNNNPVAYNISKIDLTAYVNERAKCKWDFTDTSYELMNTTFTCANTPQVRSAQTVFPCTTTLTGIKDRTENNYYIRCNDSNGNIRKESDKLTLIGTQPLYIDFAKPNSTTVKGATSPVQVNLEVKTSSGADEGNSYCSYAPIGTTSYVQFLYEDFEMNYQHTQQLSLNNGAYAYSIKCVDAGGNSVFKDIDFDVEIDTGSPVVVRAYKEDGYLKLITDEESECVYNTQQDIGCRYEYEDGIEMQTVDEDEHFVEWNSQETFYIKCKDTFDNPPLYSDCSIVARPSEGQTL